MIPLGSIPILGTHSVGEARAKIRRLALSLGCSAVVATRLATAVSEVSRRLIGHPQRPRLVVGIEAEQDHAALIVEIQHVRDTGVLRACFDEVRTHLDAEGRPALRAVRRTPPIPLDPVFLEQQRALVEAPSRAALLEEVQARNRDLEQHRQQLEQTVALRTTELREATAAAEEASRAKSTFLASMSHELRTPLNGVLGYAQLLMRDADATPRQRDRLDAIASCGKHLLSLINDVLDLSKIEAGRLELDLEPVPLRPLLDSVADISRPRAEARGLAFELEATSDLPAVVLADAAKLRQVLVNLLGNAVKFTDEGRITLAVSRTTAGPLRFDVRDTGAGIPADQLEAIFDPFRQADAGREKGGTGLGLAISRRLVTAGGGRLEATSQVGRGSCFTVHLPLEEIEAPSAAGTDATPASLFHLAPGSSHRILVADDVAANRDILASLLEHAGFETVAASDGDDALAALGAGGVDLALLDLHMPGLSAFEVAKALRKREGEVGSLPLIAVSASVFDDTPDRILGAGFDDYIPKPIHMLDVFRAIERHLRVEWREDEPGAPAAEAEPLDAEHARDVGSRLLEAIDGGDVAALTALGESLRANEAFPRRHADTVSRLAREFDLEGLRGFALRLQATENPS